MGLIRLLLAITVISVHASPIFGFNFIQGQLAVEVFFMISGFYMALILSEKYTNNKTFISNRFLKIFPTYWIILVLCLIYQLANFFLHSNPQNIFGFFEYHLHPISFILLLIPNLFIFGLDWTLFFGLNPQTGLFFFTPNLRLFDPKLYNFTLIPQAWTLSLELVFYLLAPFLNKLKTKYLLIIMSFSLTLRLFLYSRGLNHDPWNYRFFPTELIFFLAGILMYRIYQYIRNKPFNKLSIYSFFFYFSYLIFYQFLPHERTKQIILFLFSFTFIPFIFNLFKNNKIDRFIGELSYPVYISPFLIIDFLTHFTNLNHQYLGIITAGISIILSIFLIKLIIDPINRFRQSRLNTI